MGNTDASPTNVCIVGGGPAGMVLGFLLARAGVEVLVVEKHQDFFRDFRGDTIHPSTLEILHELGLLETFLQLPHQELGQVEAHFGEEKVTIADFAQLDTHCKFIAFMPQWDFLSFIRRAAEKYPTFTLRLGTEATDLLWDGARVAGVRVQTAEGPKEIRAGLVVGADGRGSTMRKQAGLEVIDSGSAIDVLWFRLPKEAEDGSQSLGHVTPGRFMIAIDRGDYWQCGYVIAKGSFEALKAGGLPEFCQGIAECAPMLAPRVAALTSWDEVKILTVKVDHLRHWSREGLLCIGDSAHAMSPVGGVGVNIAIQDAVGTANVLAAKLLEGRVKHEDLRAVQKRRERAARWTQRGQIFIHEHVLAPIFAGLGGRTPPLPMRLLEIFPSLRRWPARAVGVGLRPEHVTTRDVLSEGPVP